MAYLQPSHLQGQVSGHSCAQQNSISVTALLNAQVWLQKLTFIQNKEDQTLHPAVSGPCLFLSHPRNQKEAPWTEDLCASQPPQQTFAAANHSQNLAAGQKARKKWKKSTAKVVGSTSRCGQAALICVCQRKNTTAVHASPVLLLFERCFTILPPLSGSAGSWDAAKGKTLHLGLTAPTGEPSHPDLPVLWRAQAATPVQHLLEKLLWQSYFLAEGNEGLVDRKSVV